MKDTAFYKFLDLGLKYVQIGEYSKSIAAFDEMVNINPKSIVAFQLRSFAKSMLAMTMDSTIEEEHEFIRESISDLEQALVLLKKADHHLQETDHIYRKLSF